MLPTFDEAIFVARPNAQTNLLWKTCSWQVIAMEYSIREGVLAGWPHTAGTSHTAAADDVFLVEQTTSLMRAAVT